MLELVSDAKSINVQDNEGNTPLHIACQMDDLESIIFLASKYNCDVNLLNGDQCLPVHYAVRSRKAMEMAKVVSTGCTLIHMQNRNWMTPLHIACKEKNVDVVKYLVFEKKCFPSFFKHSSDIYDNLDIGLACEAGADISLLNAIASKQNINIQHRDLYSNTQNTPISVACICHNISAIELFVKLDCDLSFKDSFGRLPPHIACLKSLECVQMLMPGIKNDHINVHDSDGDTPIHLAVRKNHIDIVKFILLNFTCNVNIPNKKGEFLLHIACTANSLEMIKILIESGASSKCNDQTKDGDSPLHIASRIGATDIVKYLVEACDCKPSMTLRNSEGRLPVDYACKHSLKMVEMVSQSYSVKDLTSREYDINNWSYRSDHNRRTTLDIACCSGSLYIVMYLVNKRGCSLSALADDHSALGYACGLIHDSQNHPWPDVVRFLIHECRYDPSLSFNYCSVIQYGCKHKSLDC